ncbi:CD225/dispanin family protein [Pseudoxanthomonas sangjuensis]|uniref:CD225/dispanin family protein n=1 Tax=Pseudoxanthomonas sangjuensis TaxID=1503750 RepID=UPI001391586D|nr:CD225/dispanin family protein [Pseudoxanthomonas sangjuensis]KAF1710283.1 hypothetical protein CSC71_10410 [Pseudoxanthomonas sangjuensis]
MSTIPPPPATPGNVPNHLVWAIIVTVLSFVVCCFSCISIIGIGTGIVAIVFASKVNKLLAQEQFDAALQASKNAKLWSWITTGILIVGFLVFVVSFFVGGGIEGQMERMEEIRKAIEAAQQR